MNAEDKELKQHLLQKIGYYNREIKRVSIEKKLAEIALEQLFKKEEKSNEN